MLQVLRSLFTPQRRSKTAVKSRWIVSRLEEFEPRLVLDAYKWLGPAGGGTGSWFDVTDWVINGLPATPMSPLPGRNDDVTIDGTYARGPCSIPNGPGLAQCATLKLINSPSLTIDTMQTLGVFGGAIDSAMTSGTVTINGTLALAGGNFDWYGGTFTGAGSIVLGASTTAPSATLLVTQNAQNLNVNLIVGSNVINEPATLSSSRT